MPENKSLRQIDYRSDWKFAVCPAGLANLGAEKFAVAVEAHFSASQ